jgi:hypothetical protein
MISFSASRQSVEVQTIRKRLRHQRPRLDRQEEESQSGHHLLLRNFSLMRNYQIELFNKIF